MTNFRKQLMAIMDEPTMPNGLILKSDSGWKAENNKEDSFQAWERTICFNGKPKKALLDMYINSILDGWHGISATSKYNELTQTLVLVKKIEDKL